MNKALLIWNSFSSHQSPPHLHAATWLLVIQQQLHSSHHLLADRVQQGIADVDVEAQQEFNDFQVLVLNSNQQGRAAERVDAVDVDLEVDLCLLTKWGSEWKSGFVSGAARGTWLKRKILIDTECTLIFERKCKLFTPFRTDRVLVYRIFIWSFLQLWWPQSGNLPISAAVKGEFLQVYTSTLLTDLNEYHCSCEKSLLWLQRDLGKTASSDHLIVGSPAPILIPFLKLSITSPAV